MVALYVPLFAVFITLPQPLNSEADIFLPGDLGSYLGIGVYAAILLTAPMLVFHLFHRRQWSDWPTTHPAGALLEFATSASALLLILFAVTGLDFLVRPERFAVRAWPAGAWLWFGLGLLMLLPQTFAEEALFKGYLMRVWGAAFPYRWPVALTITTGFTALHGVNTDFAADRAGAIVEFMLSGLVSFALYFRTGTLAAPTGVHFANNVYALLLVNREPGGMSQGTLLTYNDPVLAAGSSLLTTPDGLISIVGGNLMLAALLLWRRSPLCFVPQKQGQAIA